MKTATHTRTAVAATALAASLLALTACTAPSSPAPTSAPAAATSDAQDEPAPTASSAPAPAPTATGPVAGPNDQVINGVLYQGTPLAPVRIGTDAPGQPPAAEATFDRKTWQDWVKGSNKYEVTVFKDPAHGWTWKAYGTTEYGVSEVADGGYRQGTWFDSREAAAAGPFVVDGRPLDRAEYALLVN